MSVLDSLKPRIIEAVLTDIYEERPKLDDDGNPVTDAETGEQVVEQVALVIYMQSVTWLKWQEIGDTVPDLDKDSIQRIRKFDASGKKLLVEDTDEINRQLRRVVAHRTFRRIGYAMQQALDEDGEPYYPDLQGKSLDQLEKIVNAWDGHVIASLSAVLIRYQEQSRGVLKRKASSFR